MAASMSDRNYNSSAVFKLIFAAGDEIHGATAPFLTSSDINSPGSNNRTLTEIMTSYWISFAVTGDPNPLRSAKATFWPSYISGGAGNSSNGEGVGFDVLSVTYTTVSSEHDSDAKPQCDFFSSQGYIVSN
jgi:Carboxylesterase family